MKVIKNIGVLALWAAAVGGCAPRAYVVSPVSADRDQRMGNRFASPTAVGSSSGAPSKVPSPEDKLTKQGSKPATQRAAESIDFTAAIGSQTQEQAEPQGQELAVSVAAVGFSGNETDHIKFSKYDPFGANGSFEISLDGLEYTYPIDGKFSSGYGPRGRSMHSGVDLVAPALTPIYAVFDGVVRLSKPYSGYGNVIVLRHNNGLETVYSHNAKNLVRVGQEVKRGQQIAQCGRTGRASTNHLHFEVRVQGVTINPALLLDLQARRLQSGVLVVSRLAGGSITARRTQPTKPEVPVEQKEVLAQTKPAASAAAVVAAAEPEEEPKVVAAAVPAAANASRGIRVGDKVYQVPESTGTTGAAVYHTVASGETLASIGRKYGTSWQKITKLNNWTIQQADRIKAGAKIRVK